LGLGDLPLSVGSSGQRIFGSSAGSPAFPRRQLVVEAQRPSDAPAQVLHYERPVNDAQFLF
jgi:hypothetical protein